MPGKIDPILVLGLGKVGALVASMLRETGFARIPAPDNLGRRTPRIQTSISSRGIPMASATPLP